MLTGLPFSDACGAIMVMDLNGSAIIALPRSASHPPSLTSPIVGPCVGTAIIRHALTSSTSPADGVISLRRACRGAFFGAAVAYLGHRLVPLRNRTEALGLSFAIGAPFADTSEGSVFLVVLSTAG
jgi:hypothetical protein